MERFDRNIRFFGAAGQHLLSRIVVAVVGCGGLGQHVVQQLAFLGVGTIILIDDEELSSTNLNRYILARYKDPVPGSKKVQIAKRAIKLINPDIKVIPIKDELRSRKAFDALLKADVIFGCLDNDGARVILNELALAYNKKLWDLATDTENEGQLRYGGRVAFIGEDTGCLICMDLLDLQAAAMDLASSETRKDRAKIYGVAVEDLEEAGPSVVSLNGIIASLAVNEFMVDVTGIRPAKRKLEYRGNQGIVTVQFQLSHDDCYSCKKLRGTADAACLDRYLK